VATDNTVDYSHELACQHGVVGWLACQDCNTEYDGRLFGCQMYGLHDWLVTDVDYEGGETFECGYCEWEVSVRHGS